MKKAINWIFVSDYGYLAMVVIIVILTNLFLEFHFVSGPSMMNTLHSGDIIVAEKVSVWTKSINRGDIIIATPYNNSVAVIKRVIGVPGDVISYHDGIMNVNGIDLVEKYIIDEPSSRVPRTVNNLKLGEGEYFIAGDNRNNSDDSIHYGPVYITNIRAKVLLHFGF